MIETRGTGCLDAETLAALAEGKLTRSEIPAVLAHLEVCQVCTHALETANEMHDEPASARHRYWLAVAAALVIVIAGVLVTRRIVVSPDEGTATLVSLAPKNGRIVEPRLTGGFGWAPYGGPMRASNTASDPASDTPPDPDALKLAGAAGGILDRARQDSSTEAQQAAGAALLLIERPLDAVTRLRAAADRAPSDAALWNDLGAAQYAAAVRLDRASLYPEALASLDRALTLRADLPEALFNRALALERLGLPAQARQAWQRYLAVDGSSPWAAEARAHLARLPSANNDSLFRSDQPRLEQAAVAGDSTTVAALVRRYPQQARTFGEAEYLGRWGEALQRGDAAEAARMLTIARAVGGALGGSTGEALLEEAVRAIDSAAGPASLAEGHVLYRRGRVTYSRHSPAAAEPDLRRAAAIFAAANDPMSLAARYFAANTRFDQNDVTGARRELEALRAEADALPRYAALGAQIRWQLALCLMQDDDWAGAIPLLADAETAFRRLGERANNGFMHVLLADAYACVGRPDEGWASRIRAFETLSAENRGDRLPAAFSAAVFVELRNGRREAARSLLRLQRGVLRETGNDVLLTLALVREAVLNAELGDTGAAWTNVREASAVTSKLTDEALRTRASADIAFAQGAVLLHSDPARARAFLGNAIDGYQRSEAPPFLAECHLLRARAALRMNDPEAARRDLDAGIDACERHRIRFADSVTGIAVLDAGPALYRESIRLAAARGDADAVFRDAERFFGQLGPGPIAAPRTLPELQRRLAGSGAMVVELVVLPQEVVTLAITADDAVIHSTKADVSSASLDETQLYDLLIRPIEGQLARSDRLIIVADPLLNGVSFAALRDSSTGRRLIERMPVATALSAGMLFRAERTHPQPSMVGVELESGEQTRLPALPGAREELGRIAKFYRRAETIDGASFPAFIEAAAQANVVHVAGHTERQDRTGEAVLVFGRNERVSWRQAAAASIDGAPIVVLAACSTLRNAPAAQLRTLSLGAGFLAAGAGDVIGTLAPISDNDARMIFDRLHRHLAAGRDAAEALRLAQLDAMAAEAAGHRNAWRSVALLTNRL